MGLFATDKPIKKTIQHFPSFDTSVLWNVTSCLQTRWRWLSGCICHGYPVASCHLKVILTSVPLAACQWRRWSRICLSQEICRSIERGLTRQTYHFLGWVIVFSFCLVVCLFAAIFLWALASCFPALFSCTHCSLFVVLPCWNEWNIWFQWKWDPLGALTGDSCSLSSPPRIISFSCGIFSDTKHASLEREIKVASWKRMVKNRTSFWG